MRAAPSGTPRWAGSVRSAGAVQRTAKNPGTLDWRAGGYLRLLERVCKVGGQTGQVLASETSHRNRRADNMVTAT